MERCGRKRARAKRSNIVLIVFKLEIGLKFEGSDLESPCFFRRGEMRACLNFDEESPLIKRQVREVRYDNLECAGA